MVNYKSTAFPRLTYLLITAVLIMVLESCGGDSDSAVDSSTNTEAAVSVPTAVPTIASAAVATAISVVVEKSPEPSPTAIPTLVLTATPTKVPDSPTATPVATTVPSTTYTGQSKSGRQSAYPTAVVVSTDHLENAKKVFPFERFDDLQSCTPGSSKEEQRQILLNMAQTFFAGTTSSNEEVKPRITHLGGSPIGPTVRDDRRSGGLWVIVEFNGDDVGEVVEKKASVDLWMMEAYNAFFNADCDHLAKVEISAYGDAVARNPEGKVQTGWAIVFKTRMERKVADEVDWANRDPVSLEGIWQILMLNYQWKEALAGR